MSAVKIGNDWVGRVIDERFALLGWLGGAGPSGVFLTQIDDPPQSAAVKLVPADIADAESLLAQWTAATRLSHPHLIRLFHAGRSRVDDRDLLYTVTEYSEEILSEILCARPLTPAEVREMLDPILGALSWLHAQGLVHGGLKPSNIMVVNDQLKLSTDRVQVAGPRVHPFSSPDIHEAPETAERISQEADVWSLGILLVEALAQQTPQRVGTGAAEAIIPASIPEPFAAIAHKCLHPNSARRCTLREIKSLLAPSAVPAVWAPKSPAATPEAPAAPPVTTRTRSANNRRAMIATVAVLLLIAAFAGVIVATRHFGPSSSHAAQPSAATTSPVPESGDAAGPTVPGAVVHRALPDVPRAAANTIRGRVRIGVRVQVDSNGNVSNADFESRGPSRYFANLALQTAHQWKFRSAQTHGHAVPSLWLLHFEFTPTDTGVTAIETAP